MGDSKLYQKSLGVAAVSYLAVDYCREILPDVHSSLQPILWGFLAVCCVVRLPYYKFWTQEVKSVGIFLACLMFMLGSLVVEAISVQFVTTVLGLDWHWAAKPLPDTGQWLLLYLNEKLPSFLVEILRAPLIGLHHYLMLFLMLAFSVLFGCVKAPGLALGARYMFTMGVGRLLRVLTFMATILPSARPWCAHARFRTANHPHPWAQKYYVPYADNPDTVRELLRHDAIHAPVPEYPPEYIPNWGRMQFLVNILRPATESEGENWFNTLKRAGGGCNDLIYSGHILVSVLTAMAWSDAYPGWTSKLIWVLVLHSAQREIRERHHYSVDCVAGLYVGIMLWTFTKFIWSTHDRSKRCKLKLLAEKEGAFLKAAKDGDIDQILSILDSIERSGQQSKHLGRSEWIYGGFILVASLGICLLAFLLTADG